MRSRSSSVSGASGPAREPAAVMGGRDSRRAERLSRSRSLPASADSDRIAVVQRLDSERSSRSNASVATTTRDGGGRDSGLGSDGEPCSPPPPPVADDRPKDDPKAATIRLHYYPEGGWGWVVWACAVLVEIVARGLHAAYGVFYWEILRRFGQDRALPAGCLGALSMSVASFLSPVVVALCRRKSTRLTAIVGGLVTSLGCLFTSFASQFHQLFFSYGLVVGLGVGLSSVTANLMIGQYFKRRRELVEVGVQSATGLGIVFVSVLYERTISSVGWRLGLQAVTGVVFGTFFLGILYRSATLYHPQRRAILHLKNQKRKIKDKGKREEKPPFFDFATVRSRTVQILLASSGLSALGINAPLVYLVYEAREEGLDDGSVMFLQAFLGLAVVLGASAFGLVVVRNSTDCRIARHYLCQAAGLALAASLAVLAAVDEYHGYVFFAWMYGVSFGGYHYALKMFTYEKVRARNFARTWSLVQWSQAVPTVVGIPIAGGINAGCGRKTGFYFCSACAVAGSAALFLVDVHRRRASRRKKGSSERRRVSSDASGRSAADRRSSLPEEDREETLAVVGPRRAHGDAKRAELTCISEEGLVDVPDHVLEEFDFLAFGDCMTSCDQVEQYLVLSEYENNLNKTNEVRADDRCRCGRSPPSGRTADDGPTCPPSVPRLPSRGPGRGISVIDEIATSV